MHLCIERYTINLDRTMSIATAAESFPLQGARNQCYKAFEFSLKLITWRALMSKRQRYFCLVDMTQSFSRHLLLAYKLYPSLEVLFSQRLVCIGNGKGMGSSRYFRIYEKDR
ncbi:hypothetical protein AVEN_64146-1 [Araneus ventricosus]|uniref:Uncharacterized protein n=1 Tax=Araneus ventricosus TaxID=182803 RepID=A0A4Y2C478_ARAVE|nr:hypothetical protein AVEN_64146-1 [Araneus ventricosus]